MNETSKPFLPRVARFLGKTAAESSVGAKEMTVGVVTGGARLFGQCFREMVEGYREGKPAAKPKGGECSN